MTALRGESHQTIWTVHGMTCAHCVSSVTEELEALPGVSSVEVTLESGEVVVSSDAPLTRTTVASAVEEAGYELAS